MKTTNNTTQPTTPIRVENRSFRRLVKQLISSWIKRQDCCCREGWEKLSEQLHEMDDLIEVMACEIARQGKRLKAIGKAVGCGNQEVNE